MIDIDYNYTIDSIPFHLVKGDLILDNAFIGFDNLVTYLI